MRIIFTIVSTIHRAKVVSNDRVTEGQYFLTLEVPPQALAEHRWPSQYVEFHLPEIEPWHGTIANRPGQDHFEFLVKDKGGRSYSVAMLNPGDEIGISEPKGEGLPLLANRNHNIILCATGVAICAMRPVIQDVMLNRSDWKRVWLFYGERHADLFAFGEERERWRESKIETFLVASRPHEGTYWKGLTGYIQDHYSGIELNMKETVAFLAGIDAMIEDFTDVLLRAGMRPNQVFLNT